MPKKVYYKNKLIGSHEFPEIDFDLHECIGFSWETHDDYEELKDGVGYADAYPIEIDRMIKKLVELNSKGATHVEIEYPDHIGYLIDGRKISMMSKEDMQEYKKEKEAALEEYVEKRKEKLRKELEDLENGRKPKRT